MFLYLGSPNHMERFFVWQNTEPQFYNCFSAGRDRNEPQRDAMITQFRRRDESRQEEKSWTYLQHSTQAFIFQ